MLTTRRAMIMTVLIDNVQSVMDADGIEDLIETAVKTAIEYEGIKGEQQVSVVLADNDYIRRLNSEYRGIDKPTDVLSFPMLENGENNGQADDINMDMDTGELVLGDIVISLEKALEQSREYGHSYRREVAFLTVHGTLHLLGYDHETDDDRRIMREREESILELLELKR